MQNETKAVWTEAEIMTVMTSDQWKEACRAVAVDRRTGRVDDDVYQDIQVAIYKEFRHIGRYDNPYKLIRCIGEGRHLKRQRKEDRKREFTDEIASLLITRPDDGIPACYMIAAIRSLLSEEDLALFDLKAEGLHGEEIGRLLNRSVAAIKVAWMRLKGRITALLPDMEAAERRATLISPLGSIVRPSFNDYDDYLSRYFKSSDAMNRLCHKLYPEGLAGRQQILADACTSYNFGLGVPRDAHTRIIPIVFGCARLHHRGDYLATLAIRAEVVDYHCLELKMTKPEAVDASISYFERCCHFELT